MHHPRDHAPAAAGWTTNPDDLLAALSGLPFSAGLHLSRVTTAIGPRLHLTLPAAGASVYLHPEPGQGPDWTADIWLLNRYHAHDVTGTLLALAVMHAIGSPPDMHTPIRPASPPRTTHSALAATAVLDAVVEAIWAARWNHEHDWLLSRIPGLTFTEAAHGYPFSAQGTWDSHPFDFRYRAGIATLGVGTLTVEGTPRTTPLWESSLTCGDALDSWLGDDAFVRVFHSLALTLARAPHRYVFAAVTATGEPVTQDTAAGPPTALCWTGTGTTVTDAYQHAQEQFVAATSAWLGDTLHLDPTPVNPHPLPHPGSAPGFTVLPA